MPGAGFNAPIDHVVDAVYLDLHGAMVTEDFEDGEGKLLRRIRAALGVHVPIVISLDYHANVTPQMVEHTDGLVGDYPPKQYVEFFAECGIENYDIMIPDATVDENPPSIAAFYNSLFDLWLEANRDKSTVNIRIISDMITALLGSNSPTGGVGYKAVELCTIMTDGSVEAHDVLRIAGDGFTQTTFNIFEHAIDEVRNEPRWRAARDASIKLCEKCQQCKFMSACGGGYLPHRFSKKNGYDNPSVYCDDLYSMFENMQFVLESRLYITKPGGERLNVRDTLARA